MLVGGASMAATARGEPYLVEFVVARVGDGAESTWSQRFSAAAEQRAARRGPTGAADPP
jgi:hypothetical protein